MKLLLAITILSLTGLHANKIDVSPCGASYTARYGAPLSIPGKRAPEPYELDIGDHGPRPALKEFISYIKR